MKLAVLFSGGKDSILALIKASKFHEVVCLISIVSENSESYMFHTPNIEVTRLQAEAIGLPLISVFTKGVKEKELDDLKTAVKKAKDKFQIEGIVSGAILSTYQSSRIQKICNDLNLWSFNPLWLMNQYRLLEEVLNYDIKAMISGVFADQLDKSYLGKILDEDLIGKISSLNINPAGEGGEIETTVLDCFFFKKKVEVVHKKVFWDGTSGVCSIDAELVEK